MAQETLYPFGQGTTMPAGYPIADDLTTDSAQQALSAKQGVKLNEKISLVELDLDSYATLTAFISTTQNWWVVNNGSYSCKLIPMESGVTYRITGNSSNQLAYAALTTDTYSAGATPSYDAGYTECVVLAAMESVDVSTNTEGAYLYVSMFSTVDLSPQKIEVLTNDTVYEMIKSYSASQSAFPTLLKLGEPTEIIYTIDDFLLAHEYDSDNNIDNLKFSNDLGETWTTVTNTYGTILNAFMFADGTFMFAAKKAEGCRIYWTRDFSTFTEATVLDYDGEPYEIEAGKTRFFILKPRSSHTYVNGVEHYCFWDYIITTTQPRIWYAISDENGVTVRAAFAFGLQQIDGVTLSARHGHEFNYNPHDGYFYALTGDSVSECHIMRGRYVDNNGTHTWTWELLATGGGYKLTSVAYDEGNLYALTDYTESALAAYKGIVSIPIDKIGLTTTIGGVVCPLKLRYWFHATEAFMRQGSYSGVAALSLGVIADNHGWRFVGTDYLGDSMHLIAKNNHNFVWVDNDKNVRFNMVTGPNNEGNVYVTYSTPPLSVSGEGWLKLSHQKTYNLTEAMRNSGATDFFEGWRGTLY